MSTIEDNLSKGNRIDLPITTNEQANMALKVRDQEMAERAQQGGAISYPMGNSDEWRIRESASKRCYPGGSTFNKGDTTARK
jgi:hypothetical protein